MRVPGFTAEASLEPLWVSRYESRYRTTTGAGIDPQSILPRLCGCDPGDDSCICACICSRRCRGNFWCLIRCLDGC